MYCFQMDFKNYWVQMYPHRLMKLVFIQLYKLAAFLSTELCVKLRSDSWLVVNLYNKRSL